MKIIIIIYTTALLALSLCVVQLQLTVHQLVIYVGAQGDFNHEVRATFESQKTYADGVNRALETITLLNLEQHLYQTNRTFGEMSEIVRERLHVKK